MLGHCVVFSNAECPDILKHRDIKYIYATNTTTNTTINTNTDTTIKSIINTITEPEIENFVKENQLTPTTKHNYNYVKTTTTYPKTTRYYTKEDISDILVKQKEAKQNLSIMKTPKARCPNELQRMRRGGSSRTTFRYASPRRCESVNKEPEQSEDFFSPCIEQYNNYSNNKTKKLSTNREYGNEEQIIYNNYQDDYGNDLNEYDEI